MNKLLITAVFISLVVFSLLIIFKSDDFVIKDDLELKQDLVNLVDSEKIKLSDTNKETYNREPSSGVTYGGELESRSMVNKYPFLKKAILMKQIRVDSEKWANNRYREARIYRTNEFKYPLIRIEHTYGKIGNQSKDIKANIMVADHFVFKMDENVNETDLQDELEDMGFAIHSKKMYSGKYIITFKINDDQKDEFYDKLNELKKRPDLGNTYIDYIASIN